MTPLVQPPAANNVNDTVAASAGPGPTADDDSTLLLASSVLNMNGTGIFKPYKLY
jgi:hypothetical protein